MVDTVLHLAVEGGDDFYFTSFEVPEKIQFGGRQALAVHKLVGGRRQIDAMGRDDASLAWSGWFLGTSIAPSGTITKSALERARYLDYLRISGKPCVLTWSELSYKVVVESFTADFERFYKMPYSISCMVVADLAQPVTTITSPSLDDVMRDDIDKALAAGALIGNTPLNNALAALSAAAQKIANMANASQAAIASVTGPIQQVQSLVGNMVASAGASVGGMATLGGIISGGTVAQQAARITSGATAAVNLPALLGLQAVVARMGKNMGLGK